MANKKTPKVRALAKARPKAKARKNPNAAAIQSMPKKSQSHLGGRRLTASP
jgi:hypothetical protein